MNIVSPHLLQYNLKKTCNGFGKRIRQKGRISLKIPDHNYYYFNHYYFKSSEEYLQKLSKGSVITGTRKVNLARIALYFAFNKISKKKIDYFEKKTNLDLNIFKNNSYKDLYFFHRN